MQFDQAPDDLARAAGRVVAPMHMAHDQCALEEQRVGVGEGVGVAVPKDDAPAPKAKAPKQPKAKAPNPASPKRVSLLDAAATVLADAKAPMQAKQIVDAVVERGLWKPGAGKTPHATLYAAMTREIAAKGKDARFRKVGRGQFTAAGKGA